MKNIITIILIALTLQGCIFVAGAAAGAAGAAIVYDHRKLSQIALDQEISNAIYEKIHKDPILCRDAIHIEVTTFNQIVLLTGQALDPESRKRVDEIAHHIPNVKRVYNDVAIRAPTSSLTRASDSWITTKIKTQMLATKGMKSSSIKVVTENGTVYLMGIVSHQQADIAVDIARTESGVQRVVRIFNYKD